MLYPNGNKQIAIKARQSISSALSSINPTTKIVFAAATGLATVASIISVFGLVAFSWLAVVGLAASGWQLYKMSRKIQYLEESLGSELPHHHRFLVEFLRTTYISRGREIIVKKNNGAQVNKYENNFYVRGVNCSNKQRIKGRNVSETPIRGISFALVGGSSMSTEALGSRYRINNNEEATPEFIVDDDRFKIAFCQFSTPLEQNKEFDLIYSDSWQGAMRKMADGFFFPEALYFPGGIGELSVRLEFDFKVKSLAALEVNTDNFSVVDCDSQPKGVKPSEGMKQAFKWSKLSPSQTSMFILFYRAV